jgi:hypothetical protein
MYRCVGSVLPVSGRHYTSAYHLKTRTVPMNRWTTTKYFKVNPWRIVQHSIHMLMEDMFLIAEHQQWKSAVWAYNK